MEGLVLRLFEVTLQGASVMIIEGAVIDVDYLIRNNSALIRLTVKGVDGGSYEVFDSRFMPYFYLLADEKAGIDRISDLSSFNDGQVIKPLRVEECEMTLAGKRVKMFKVFAQNPMHIPKLSSAAKQYGTCYEYDIPFAKRYLLDNDIIPLSNYNVTVDRDADGKLVLKSMSGRGDPFNNKLNTMCFDIEVYNPLGVPRADKDPVIMISYSYRSNGAEGSRVITYKRIDENFVDYVKDEKELFAKFVGKVKELDIDLISGYNSANFDIRYMIERAKFLGIDFNLSRYVGETKLERHGLVDRVKIAGRVHIDMYLVIKFIAVVTASDSTLKNTLKDVYEAISGDKKTNVDKLKIYEMWDGGEEPLRALAVYNLSDSHALQKVFDMFMPLVIELARTTGDMLSDASVSTTGQLVDYLLMRYSVRAGEIIPNKPDDLEIKRRAENPIEGAYVKTPEPGIYSNLVVFDFRGLYPSIIISYNIDPTTICTDCKDYYESPIGIKFDKKRVGVMPLILKLLIDQRASVKKLYRENPNDTYLGSRSQALKILSNSFYGYLGYARSRWYSRNGAASVTAYGRQYIKEAIASAENNGFKVIYGDTDSLVFLRGNKSKDDAINFLKSYNSKLPESMELELEDFYRRGVFVGKRSDKGVSGAKKKYALIAENGKIKIRGFELVRRDWSKLARDTQRLVLEAILEYGSKEKAADIVRDAVKKLREGKVNIHDLAISTQLRKSIDSYDAKSPELGAAKKAVKRGLKKKEELEHAIISYVITKHGSTISDKAELEEFAKDYDPGYYINNQVIPATMKILKELNFSEEDLKGVGSQKKL